MTLLEIRQKIRSILDDNTGSDTLRYWSDVELNEYINSSIEEMCERTLCITDSLSRLCLISLVANKRHYAINDSILEIHTAQPSWRQAPLSKQSVITVSGGWLQSIGMPDSYLLDYNNNTLSLTSAPAAVSGETIRLTTSRLPLVDLENDDDIPELNRQYHRKLPDGVLAQAYLKQDAEVYNPAKAQAHRAKWDDILATTVRRESRLKPRVLFSSSMEMA